MYSSDPERGEQNLGWTDADRPESVSSNREHFIAAVSDGAALELVITRQCHGARVSVIEAGHGPLRVDQRTSSLEGDGLVTSLAGLLLGVITADCVPVLLVDTRTHAVGAFHAGWRGTVARIVQNGVDVMIQRTGSRREDLQAAVGPAIGPCCFAVGEDVCLAFREEFTYGDDLIVAATTHRAMRDERASGTSPFTYLDLHAANRRQLLDAGLAPEAIHSVGECTACTRDPQGRRKYFSHRAEHGFTGRMLSVIGVVE